MDVLAQYQPKTAAVTGAKVAVPVFDRDKALLAYGRCKRCYGRGYVRIQEQFMVKAGATYQGRKYDKDTKLPFVNPPRRDAAQVNPLSGKAKFTKAPRAKFIDELCPCAQDRFPRLQATLMDQKTGELFYTEPILYITDETRALWDAAVAQSKAKGGPSEVVRATDAGSAEGAGDAG